MKRIIPALLLVIALLTGCGASGGAPMDNAMTESMPQVNGSMGSFDGDYGWIDSGAAEDMKDTAAGNLSTEVPSAPSSPTANAKLIYTADVTLQTKEYDAACAALNELVTRLGGYFEMREVNQGGTYRSLYCVVRVPAEHFSALLAQAGTIANMTYCNEYSRDVSEAYYDLEARLTTQRTKLQRLQELLAKAADMADIITIESAISDTELQIEYLTGSLRNYDSLIGFSTVNINLHEVYRLSTEEETPVTFGDRLSTAFKRGLQQGVENVEDFIIFVARNWLSLIIWGAIIGGAVVIVVRRRAKRRAAIYGHTPDFLKKDAAAKTDEQDKK